MWMKPVSGRLAPICRLQVASDLTDSLPDIGCCSCRNVSIVGYHSALRALMTSE
jgi:hypothetical protein